MPSPNRTEPQRSLADLAAEDEARRLATGASGRSMEAMMANISAQVTREASDRRASEKAPQTTDKK